MCIIVFDNRQGTQRLDREVLERCEIDNPDGMGIMYPSGGKKSRLINWRTMKDLDGIWNRYCSARSNGLPVAMHFRITTHGTTDLNNCHPFMVDDASFGLMHNGTIPTKYLDLKKGQSDTAAFRDMIKLMPGDFLKYDSLRGMVQGFIGSSRVLFMDWRGNYTILNESDGKWAVGKADDGVWFSHSRDNGFYLTGQRQYQYKGKGKKQSWHQNPYSSGWDRTFGAKKNHGFSPDWNESTERSNQPRLKLKADTVWATIERYSKERRLIFACDILRDDYDHCGLSGLLPKVAADEVTIGEISGYRLDAMRYKDEVTWEAAPVVTDDDNDIIHGYLYVLRGSDVDHELKKVEDLFKPTFHVGYGCPRYREQVDVQTPHGTVKAWIWRIPKYTSSSYERVGTFTEGDTSFDPVIDITPSNSVSLIPTEEKDVQVIEATVLRDKADHICGVCYDDEVFPYMVADDTRQFSEEDGEFTEYWCQTCTRQYSMDMMIDLSELRD